MESPLSRLRMNWDHEPDRLHDVRNVAQRDRCKSDASELRTARWKDWFRPATCELIGDPASGIPAGETCSFWVLAGHGGVGIYSYKHMTTPSLPVLDPISAASA